MLDDLSHTFGGDLALSATGDVARTNGFDRSRQRVLRRLLTNPGAYLSHLDYGAGAPTQVGQSATPSEIMGLVKGQMLLEASVARDPAPAVKVRAIQNGVSVSADYTALPDAIPTALSFTVEA